MRLIDADELKGIYCAGCDNQHLCAENPACDTVWVLCSMPTIEAEPIIRCKECKWCHSGYCAKADDLIPFGLEQYEWEDWYCAWGKRRDEVEEQCGR